MFEKINRIGKPVAQLKEKTNNQYKNTAADITTDLADFKNIKREYCKQFYPCKFDNLDEIDQFLQKHKLP